MRNEALAEYWIKSFEDRYGELPSNLEATVRAWANRVPTPGPDPSLVRPRIFANIGMLHSRRLREWAEEDGIDQNDPHFVRLVIALDEMRKFSRTNKTKEQYKAEYKALWESQRTAMKAYCKAHGKDSIRFPYGFLITETLPPKAKGKPRDGQYPEDWG